MENALRESEERFRIALQNSNIVVYNQDKNLRYTWIYNPLLGFTPEGIIGKTDADVGRSAAGSRCAMPRIGQNVMKALP